MQHPPAGMPHWPAACAEVSDYKDILQTLRATLWLRKTPDSNETVGVMLSYPHDEVLAVYKPIGE